MSDDTTRPAAPLESEPGTAPLPAAVPALPPAEAVQAVPPVQPLAAAEPYAAAPRTRAPRMRTLVLGLVLAAVSVTTLLELLTGVHVDGGAVALAVLIVSGVLLVAGGVVATARDARSGR